MSAAYFLILLFFINRNVSMALSLIMTSIFSALPYLVRNAAGSVIAGIFVVIAFIALLLLAIRAFYPRSTFSSAS